VANEANQWPMTTQEELLNWCKSISPVDKVSITEEFDTLKVVERIKSSDQNGLIRYMELQVQ